ncbi:MAG TPA: 16S rRNA (cytidine(1402)-2'-O)-methyltransferase [Fimbriimonadaceae bacterium]|nr:16S rRNA (cytidine(1402)-2'-O)-methyltransferase [Fimbriimonadaceae bacterium]
MAASAGKLTLVATPIGNLGDLSPRSVDALSAADLWLVEDTRVSGKLQAHLGIKKPMRVVNEHTSGSQIERHAEDLRKGLSAVLLTDGGTPGVSDPGALLTDLCHEEGVAVDAIPGPSAVTTALMLSGFFAQRFCFLGFLPRKPGAIRAELTPFVDSTLTLVLFESPFRVEKLLPLIGETLGSRRYAICREMTKLHQQVIRGKLPDLPQNGVIPQKGEFSLVVEGKRSQN